MDSEPLETVEVNFTLAAGEAQMHLSLRVPAGRVTVTELLPVLQGLTTQIADVARSQLEQVDRHISCRAGCGACCRQLVPLSIFEAEALGQWIRSLPEEQQQALQLRFHATLLALRDKGILDRMSPELWEEGSAQSLQVVLDYQAAGVPCPFLENESCSIHPIRPLICREYMVTSPPEFCAAPVSKKVEGVRLPLKFSKALYQLGAKLEGDVTGWIPLVFLMHWMKSGAAPGERMAGPAPEVLHGILAELAS